MPTPPTIAVRPDERGLDRLRLVRSELGSRRLLVPGLGEAWVLEANGGVVARLDVGGRANFLVPVRPGPAIGENEIELYFDVPTLQTADVDGDGRADVVATNRHALRIHRQRPDGSFATAPDREIALRLIPLDDHVRNTGSVRSELRDLNGDGRADLLVSHTSGGFLRAANRTRIHLNRDGSFDLEHPDQVFERSGGVAADELVDLDGDGRPEWLRVFLRFGLLQMAELFVQRRVDLDAAIHRPGENGRFEEAPWLERRVTLPFDFETLRPRGFPPTVGARLERRRPSRLDLVGRRHVGRGLARRARVALRDHGRAPGARQRGPPARRRSRRRRPVGLRPLRPAALRRARTRRSQSREPAGNEAAPVRPLKQSAARAAREARSRETARLPLQPRRFGVKAAVEARSARSVVAARRP